MMWSNSELASEVSEWGSGTNVVGNGRLDCRNVAVHDGELGRDLPLE